MKDKNKIEDYLLSTKEPYILKIENMQVEMTYMDNNKNFEDCMKNILKQRIGK